MKSLRKLRLTISPLGPAEPTAPAGPVTPYKTTTTKIYVGNTLKRGQYPDYARMP